MEHKPNTMKNKSQVRCLDCNLDFTSQIVLEAHLQGSRHAKQMKTKNILANLQNTNPSIGDQEANGLKCDVCNVYLNSLHQYQTHLTGNRHLKKVAKGSDMDPTGINEAVKMETAPILTQPINQVCTQSTVSEITPAEKTKKKDKKPKPVVILTCSTCNKIFNSESQLQGHLSSPKHLNKIKRSGIVQKPNQQRFSPYKKNQINTKNYSKSIVKAPVSYRNSSRQFTQSSYDNQCSSQYDAECHSGYGSQQYDGYNYKSSKPLTNNFVSGGYTYSY